MYRCSFCVTNRLMYIIRGLSGFVYSLLVVYTLLVYGLCYWTPTSHWLAGFMMMSLPVLILLHVLFFGFFVVIGNRLWITAVGVLLLAAPFYSRLIKLGDDNTEADKENVIKVVSYNLLRFDDNKSYHKDVKVYENEFLKWLEEQEADILCFQEFAPYKGSKKNYTAKWFERAGYKYSVGNKSDKYDMAGPVIFSKYPLIHKKYMDFDALNGIVGADVLIGEDTVSVFSVHLHSMTLKLGTLIAEETYEGRKKEGRITVNKMKEGWEKRKNELVELEEAIVQTPYPVLICGDFNETPFSYVYGKLSKLLNNAFEVKGSGFGFTFNNIPYFIRIDNQFYDGKQLDLMSFKTDNKVKFSDHYPLVGAYQLKK